MNRRSELDDAMKSKLAFTISFALSLVLFAGLFVLLVNIVGKGVCTSDSWIPKASVRVRLNRLRSSISSFDVSHTKMRLL